MPITAKQHERRRRYLGSSDMAAVLGLNPYRNAADVFMEKTSDLEAWDGNRATHLGNVLEDVLIDEAARQLGVKVRRNVFRVHGNKIHAANLDAQVVDRPFVIEAKTAGLLNPAHKGEEWGDEGTDEIPESYLVQTQHQLYVTGAARAYVPAFLGGRGFCMFRVERNETLIGIIAERGALFWQDYVLTRTPPPDEVPSLEVLSRVRREPESTVQIDPVVFYAYLTAKDAAKEASAEADRLKAAVLAQLGTAEAGECADGGVTYLEQTRKSLNAKRLKAEHPDIFEQFETVSSYRVLREKRAKGV